MESSSNQNILREEYVLPIYKSSDRDNSVEREVIVKFLDTSNEEKYERLVKEEKIKTPLKRKLPSPNNSISQNDCNQDNGKQSMKKSRSDRNNTPDSSTDGTDGTDDFHDSREVETNQEILARRQKQIDYGKNTIGYETYTKLVPKNKRKPEDPSTPPRNIKYSRRAFDGLVKVWRKKLHCYDPDAQKTEENDNK